MSKLNLILICTILSTACGSDDSPMGGGGTDAAGTLDDGGTTSSAGDTTGGDETTGDGTDTSGIDACITVEPDCPADALELGVAGALSVDTLPVSWEFSDVCEASLGDPVYVRVPEDIESLSITVESGGAQTLIGFLEMDGETLIDVREFDGPTGIGQPPLKHLPAAAASTVLPMGNATFPTPGCLALQPLALSDLSGQSGEVHFVSRRVAGGGRLSVNAVVVEGAGDVPDAELSALFGIASEILENNDAATVDEIVVTRVTTPDGAVIPFEGPEINALRSEFGSSDPNVLNVFFIDSFAGEPGLLGIAAGVPGPNGVAGTASSGVTVALAGSVENGLLINTQLLAETVAHEIGHQMGLFHSTESMGEEHDLADDTPQCTLDDDLDGDGMLFAEECPDGHNLMFWTSGAPGFVQDELSPTQSDVFFFSPTIR